MSKEDERWVYLTTAPDQLTAEMWVELLSHQGIPAMIRPQDMTSFLGTSVLGCRLIVPKEHLEEARTALEDSLGEPEPDGP
jgi:hypothetical protein